jgi:dihydroorotate dehydrogenase electron transfer subunit
MDIQLAKVLDNRKAGKEYRLLKLVAGSIAPKVRPGQFIHLKVPGLDDAVLRRPFSVYKADRRTITILYKTVGRGTGAMGSMVKGDKVSILGPLGNGFPAISRGTFPVLVAGGYGVAPLSMLASLSQVRGVVFIGGACREDVLCAGDFRKKGWKVMISTEDGSLGQRGMVTDVLDKWLKGSRASHPLVFYACGPDGMLKAVGKRVKQLGCRGWFSLDKHMGCGMGACLACVQRIRSGGGELLVRICREGPVFEASEIIWE